MIWKLQRGAVDLSQRGLIMGVLNVTPDSFSDGGRFIDPSRAVEHALKLREDGADIIDIGGESTRPGAPAVDEEEELRRVVPIVRELRKQSDVLISVDTSKATVASAAMAEGADIINDVTALGGAGMPEVAARTGAGVVLMHMQGDPRTMQAAPQYEDVVTEVANFLRQRIASVLGYGMAAESMVIDPGIGFGKTPEHNVALLRGLKEFSRLERPVLIGVSRKSFLARVANATTIEERLWPAVALTSYGREMGARIFRVHDPKPHAQALRMTEAIVEP